MEGSLKALMLEFLKLRNIHILTDRALERDYAKNPYL
jgi:hypothetical protein